MIEIRQLTKIYGNAASNGAVTALAGVDLTIRSGMFGLLGPNGAGKTTLLRILAGIVNPSGGSVIIGGHTLATEHGKQAVKAMLGYLPQELGLYPDLTARQFVDYMAILKGINDARLRRHRVGDVLELVGLTSVADRKLKGFSGGMKRRAGIAQALVNDPKLLIVDEPTAGLDPEERIRFRNLLVNLAADRAVILSTHIVEDIGQTCRDLAVLAKGTVRFEGTPLDLTRAAEGHVWSAVLPPGAKPPADATVVSMLHLAEGIQYRLVGHAPPSVAPVQPGLEDGYVWLMKATGESAPAEAYAAS